MTAPGNIIIRTDANSTIGAGHLMRCLALAQAWQDLGGQATFAMHTGHSAFAERLHAEGCTTACIDAYAAGDEQDAISLAKLASHHDAQWLAVDGYNFDSSYLRAAVQTELPLLMVNDLPFPDACPADLIVNPNACVNESMYPNRKPTATLLLGAAYAMLRREFRHAASQERLVRATPEHVLLTMGGADPDNITAECINELAAIEYPNLMYTVVVGPANPHHNSIVRAIANHQTRCRLLENVTDMAPLMLSADLAITAGGSTCWELAAVGLPSIILILADNQEPIAQAMHTHKAAINLGRAGSLTAGSLAGHLIELLDDDVQRQSMSNNGRQLIDAQGSRRVVQAMLNLEQASFK